ncbi:MAG: response regulator transcription factor [Caldilineaceae bacterium]
MSVEEAQIRADVDDLLVQLLACLDVAPMLPAAVGKERLLQEVMLDVCINGARYTLTRCPHETSNGQINLSPREKEIVRLVCEGLPNKAISDVLAISPWTVGTYLKRIFAKLGVNSRAEMVARVLREGLLEGLTTAAV